jgi:hypothetical protein
VSEYEEIVLVGGPADGERLQWRGSDVAYVSPRRSFSSSPVFEQGDAGAQIETYAYRRSLKSKHLFVFQP